MTNSQTTRWCLLALALLLGNTGCRAPWSRMPSDDPSFQGLLDAEREDARLLSKRPLVTRNRPGDAYSDSQDRFADATRHLDDSSEFEDTRYPVNTAPRSQRSRDDFALDSQTERDIRDAEEAYGQPAAEMMKQSLIAARSQMRAPEARAPAPRASSEELGTHMRMTDQTPSTELAQKRQRLDDSVRRRVNSEELASSEMPARSRQPSRTDMYDPRTGRPIDYDVTTASHTSRDTLPSGIEERLRQNAELDETATPIVDTRSKGESWQESVRSAIAALNSEILDTTNPEQKIELEKNSRLLSMTVGDLSAAMEPVPEVDAHVQQYLQHSLQAWTDVTDPAGHPQERKRATLALQSQRKAIQHLASASDLQLGKATFCTAVESYGDIEEFADSKFQPGDEVLLYFEVDNFVSLPLPDGKNHETYLRGNYEIVASDSGQRVDSQSLKEDRHVSRIPRRDYFMVYRIWMPTSIGPGDYTMRLTVEDVNGRKFGEASVDFKIAAQ